MKLVFVCVILVAFSSVVSAQEDTSSDTSGGVEFKSGQGHRFKVPEDMIVVKHPGYVALVPVDEYLGKKILQYDDRFKKMQEMIDLLKVQVVELQQQIMVLQAKNNAPVENSNQTVPLP